MPFGSISCVDSAGEFLWPQFRQVWSSATEKISRQQIYTELLFLFFSHASAPEVWFATNLSNVKLKTREGFHSSKALELNSTLPTCKN